MGSNPTLSAYIMYYVYLLFLNNGNIYTGSTNNLERRLKEHKNGKVYSTQHKRPIKLIHYEVYLLKSDAQRREKFLKTTEGKRLLKMQLKNCFNELMGSPRHSTGRPVG